HHASPRKQGKKENGPPHSHTLKGRRLVFDN
nr:Chain F, Cell division control protein 6 homolog [Homo sapiens]2CCI_I Chain I, Cell division control protein 6 homolog [Homo sapiens]